jgi:hypothetical protein
MTIRQQSHHDSWPSHELYTLANRCPTCKAAPGVDCNAPNRARRQTRLLRQHLTRQDAGARHHSRDVGAAPWPEDREPGRCYCTLEPCPLAAS